MSMADSRNPRIINMVEVAENFFKPTTKTMGDIMDEVAMSRDRQMLQLSLQEHEVKLRELYARVVVLEEKTKNLCRYER